ncbi:MAG: 30S ribosomal protein S20, partial [Candidatus Gribaldobacteria bacterium]|nr:30S ribosomal protein S20 [Candidatus Gribaldobacteria bacterium]
MAITQSAKKAQRQSLTRNARNQDRKKKVKDLVKQIRLLVSEKKATEAQKLLPQAYKILDKTAKVGTLKKNNASRRKSRLTLLVNKALKEK